MKRREFLGAALAGAAMARGTRDAWNLWAGGVIALVSDPRDPVAAAPPPRAALATLARRLADAGATVRTHARVENAGAADLCIVACGTASPTASAALSAAGVAPPRAPGSLAVLPGRAAGRRTLTACAPDGRGLAYALLDLADRVRPPDAVLPALALPAPIAARPATPVRSVMRQFVSETFDKPWFYDRRMWPRYLEMLATHRFNRLHLAFGLGYDSLQHVVDSYFLFLYPFLVDLPGYGVRVTNLSDAERARNLDTLRFISDETVAHGLDFQLGIWMHGYQLADSPRARYVVQGLTPQTHAVYCRDALGAVLRACPAISAVALRIHGESGVAEGSYDFWSTVFDGVARCGRAVEIDLHAKGLDATMVERALATGMPVNVSPKFAAEHLGLPYHQAAIRELEMPVPGRTGAGLMTLSEGSRSFTRYGYADFLREDRRYTVRPRVFSGTQRILAWGDPAWTAAYARSFAFCGMTGGDLMEPLTCRGRRGTAVGSRIGYRDLRRAPRWDWEKYAPWYRAWGRMLYDPATPGDVFRREQGSDAAARHRDAALAQASRILPLVTTAHLPSAACDTYWPEIYWSQPMVEPPHPNPYADSPAPGTFQSASPLDPQLFSSARECAEALLDGARTERYSPLEVAVWLDGMAAETEAELARAGGRRGPATAPIVDDVAILAGIGRFFAAKMRSGVLYALYERSHGRGALEEALAAYRRARAAWAEVAARGGALYQADLSASDRFDERGQWADRLAEIDRDVALMAARLSSATVSRDPRAAAAVAEALRPPGRPLDACVHTPSNGFRPGTAVEVDVLVGRPLGSARLRYRHVNQAERWEVAVMDGSGGAWRGAIPAPYTASAFPLQYYFELRAGPGEVWLHPGLAPDLASQPYYVLRRI